MSKMLLYGKGVNDSKVFIRKNGKLDTIYNHWSNMLCRCFSEKYAKRRQLCIGSTVCDEWLVFSKFEEWCKSEESGFRKGYCLDKDLLINGNMHYCPQACCFVPNEINTLTNRQPRQRGLYPIGVTRDKKSGMYIAQISKQRKNIVLGRFNTIEEAFSAYKQAKEKYIKEVAQKYYDKGEITKRVYDALMAYKIKTTD